MIGLTTGVHVAMPIPARKVLILPTELPLEANKASVVGHTLAQAEQLRAHFDNIAADADAQRESGGFDEVQIEREGYWPAWINVALALSGFDLPAADRELWVRRQLLGGAWPALVDLLEAHHGHLVHGDTQLIGRARHALADAMSSAGGFLGNARVRLARDELDRSVLRTYGSEHAVFAVSELAKIPLSRWTKFSVTVDGIRHEVGAHIVGHSQWIPTITRTVEI
jgi:hypothetical protein